MVWMYAAAKRLSFSHLNVLKNMRMSNFLTLSFAFPALKQKMAFGAVVWQRSRGGRLWAYLQAFMLSQLVRGRSAFGTARLPVWGQLNTAWDWALKACPVRSEVLFAFVCVCVCVRASVCVRESVCNALIKFDELAVFRWPKIQFVLSLSSVFVLFSILPF